MQIIRLSKVIRELGVGASTAVEFLQKKGYDIDNNLNAKISEEQYNVLQKEFSKDKKQKEESNKFFQERQNNKERNRVTVSTGEQNKKREELIEVTLPETVHVSKKLEKSIWTLSTSAQQPMLPLLQKKQS